MSTPICTCVYIRMCLLYYVFNLQQGHKAQTYILFERIIKYCYIIKNILLFAQTINLTRVFKSFIFKTLIV